MPSQSCEKLTHRPHAASVVGCALYCDFLATFSLNYHSAKTFVTISHLCLWCTPQPAVEIESENLGIRFTRRLCHDSLIRPQAKAVGASFTGTKNPAYVTLTIGSDSGATSVTAKIFN
jgi:hypothetical protein